MKTYCDKAVVDKDKDKTEMRGRKTLKRGWALFVLICLLLFFFTKGRMRFTIGLRKKSEQVSLQEYSGLEEVVGRSGNCSPGGCY